MTLCNYPASKTCSFLNNMSVGLEQGNCLIQNCGVFLFYELDLKTEAYFVYRRLLEKGNSLLM